MWWDGVPAGTYVLTEQALAASAVEAVAAQFRVVRRHAVADLECRHLGPDGGDDTHGFVARDEGELGDKLALVDVLLMPCQHAAEDMMGWLCVGHTRSVNHRLGPRLRSRGSGELAYLYRTHHRPSLSQAHRHRVARVEEP